MPENDAFWDFYWEVRLQALEDMGKREAVLAVSRLVRELEKQPGQPIRLLELGCGEAQIIGALVEAHAQAPGMQASVGVDYLARSIEKCRRTYPGLRFIEGDFTDPALWASLEQFEILLMVNALHEVFSATYSDELGEVDVPVAKQRVRAVLTAAVEHLAPGGYLVIFDGLERSGDIQSPVQIRFRHRQARSNFETFAREYHPFQIRYRAVGGPDSVVLSWRDFTRYITKSIFLGKRLWQTERLESYQYFNEMEFREAIEAVGLKLCELRTLTVNYEKWRAEVEIETPGVDFPAEHILIVAQK